MNKDAKEKLRSCDPCQRFSKGNSQDNLFPGHTLHLDFCEYNGKDYILIVDRMTGYIGAEQTANQGTDAAISAVKNWSTKFGYPYKIISDSGGAFRKTFKEKLKILGVKHTHSSATTLKAIHLQSG